MIADLRGQRVKGNFIHAADGVNVDVMRDWSLVIGEDGVIADYSLEPPNVVLPEHVLIIPGLIDLHVHAPQYPQLGQALDVPLEEWLAKYTFPLEAKYADLGFAHQRYETLVGDLLANGTTTAVYFATVHREASQLLAEICLAKGQRALVGKVAMDDPASCPDYYRDASADEAIAETRAFIDHVQALSGNDRVLPVITPRFTPSCTDALLTGLGALAKETGCYVQTHCSESDWAHNHALQRFGVTDTQALDRFGLLSRRTILAHGNFISDDDMWTIGGEADAVIAHCALSNMYFANAVFPLRKIMSRAIHVGLGTDISGGPSASMLEACRATVQASRVLEDGVDARKLKAERGVPDSRVTMLTAFHLATAGAGRALNLPIGFFGPGYRFDAVMIDLDAPNGTVRRFGETDPLKLLETALYTASRSNIASVYIDGQRVSGAAA